MFQKNTKHIYIYTYIIYIIYIYIRCQKKSYEYIPWDSRCILYQIVPWAPEVAPILIDAARQGLKLGHPAAALMCWMKRAWKFWKFELGRIWKDFYDFLKDFYDFLWKIWWISMVFYGRYDDIDDVDDIDDILFCLSRFLFNPPRKNTINPMKYPEFMTYPLVI